MSFYFTEAGPVNSVENASAIAPSKAYKGSDSLSELTPLKDEYKGFNWDYGLQSVLILEDDGNGVS